MQQPVNILIIEDSQAIATRLKNMLKETPVVGEVKHASTLSEAWELMQIYLADIVMLDISLPDGNGLDFLKLIRKNYKDIQVIMFSNHAGARERELAQKNGTNYFLDKSLDFDKVIPVIESIAGIL